MQDMGIIGGADGPTLVFLASRFPWWIFGIVMAVVVMIVLTVVCLKKK